MSDDTEKALLREAQFVRALDRLLTEPHFADVDPAMKAAYLDYAKIQMMGLAVDATEQPATKGVIH